MTRPKKLTPEQRHRQKSEAGKKGADAVWHPEKVVEAAKSGAPIPMAPVRPRQLNPPAPTTSAAAPGNAVGEPTPKPAAGVGAGPSVPESRPPPAPATPPASVPITNTTPPPTSGPAPSSWYAVGSGLPKAGPDDDGDVSKNPDFDLGSGMLVDTVAMAHNWAADESGYEGWRLKPDELALWQKIIRFLLRKLPLKDWPIIATMVALAIMEGKKFIGWSRYRKAKNAGVTRPTRAPPPSEPGPSSAPAGPPAGAYMAPRQRGAAA